CTLTLIVVPEAGRYSGTKVTGEPSVAPAAFRAAWIFRASTSALTIASCSLVCLRHRNNSSCPSRRQISPEISTRLFLSGSTSRKTFLPSSTFLDSTGFSFSLGLFLGRESSRSAAPSQPSIKPTDTKVRRNKPNREGRVDVLIAFSVTSRATVENKKSERRRAWMARLRSMGTTPSGTLVADDGAPRAFGEC